MDGPILAVRLLWQLHARVVRLDLRGVTGIRPEDFRSQRGVTSEKCLRTAHMCSKLGSLDIAPNESALRRLKTASFCGEEANVAVNLIPDGHHTATPCCEMNGE